MCCSSSMPRSSSFCFRNWKPHRKSAPPNTRIHYSPRDPPNSNTLQKRIVLVLAPPPLHCFSISATLQLARTPVSFSPTATCCPRLLCAPIVCVCVRSAAVVCFALLCIPSRSSALRLASSAMSAAEQVVKAGVAATLASGGTESVEFLNGSCGADPELPIRMFPPFLSPARSMIDPHAWIAAFSLTPLFLFCPAFRHGLSCCRGSFRLRYTWGAGASLPICVLTAVNVQCAFGRRSAPFPDAHGWDLCAP